MQKPKNKIATILIAALLIFSMSASIMLIPTTDAHTPAWNIPTYAYIHVAPDPIGVGQKVNVIMWLDQVISGAAVSNGIRFHNYNLTVIQPGGSVNSTIFPVCTDTTSAQYYAYTPASTGNYTFIFSFPGQTYTWSGDYQNDTYSASNATTTLTVQSDQISAISSYPLPTEYWTRPIYGENTYWYTISSDWLGTSSPAVINSYVADAVGSQTSHVMWTKELQSGGVTGGNSVTIQGDTYFEGSAYINRFTNPIILDGMLYYKEPLSFASGSGGNTDCVDLRTGELIWSSSTVPSLSFGLVFDIPPGNPNQHGVYPPVLIATTGGFSYFGNSGPLTWMGYDGDTGQWLFNMTNIPSGTKALGSNGEILIYTITNYGNATNPNYYLNEWNSTKVFYSGSSFFGLSLSSTGTFDASASNCYDWNVSIPWYSSMGSSTIIGANDGDLILCYNGTLPSSGLALTTVSYSPYTYFAINMNSTRATVGSKLWSTTLSPPSGNLTVFQAGYDFSSRVFLEYYKQTGQWVGYSMDTGAKLWGPTASQTANNAFDYYGNQFSGSSLASMAYGNVYSSGFSGILYCYDAKTGDLKWTYGNGGTGNNTNAGYYNGYGIYPTMISAVGNGIVYLETTEHTITTPIYKGALTRAVNATDGTEIWTLSDYTGGGASGSAYAIADGFATFFNGYDNQIYVTGRGSSATTVEAPKTAVDLGRSLIISGTVTDTSSGTTQDQQAADFHNGVPVSSDASMTDWMGYVYQQKPLPTNFTGVDVTISVIDSNNNQRIIGTAKTDSSGTYSYQWTPDITGKYTVIASFSGTNGYWPSSSETSFAVDPAAPTQAPTSAPLSNIATTSDLLTYLAIGVVAIIIAIALVGVLLLRKHP
jgi:outer membrane protein assembly factor BamB